MNLSPADRDLVARLPFKAFLVATGGKVGYEEMKGYREALSFAASSASDASDESEDAREIFQLALESYPVHYRLFASGQLIDDPARMRAGIAAIEKALPSDRAAACREDLLALTGRFALLKKACDPLIPSLSREATARSQLEAILRGNIVESVLRRADPLPVIERRAESRVPGARHAGAEPNFFTPYIPPPNQISWWEKGEGEATCVRIINETADVKTFCFKTDPNTLFSYKPGQFLTFDLEIDGEKVKRSYSLSATPSRPGTLAITVKRCAAPKPGIQPGLVSNWLHDKMKVGDKVRFRGPNGRFTCADSPCDKVLFISAGSGVVPVMGMARWLTDSHAKSDIIFYHSARTMADFIYRRELEWMASMYENFRLVLTVTQPKPTDVYYGFTGRFSRAQLEIGFPDFRDRQIYLCGPNPFMEGVKQILQEAGFPMEQFHWESFGGAATPKPTKETKAEIVANAPTKALATGGTIVFSKSGTEVTCGPKDYLLDVAEKHGIDIAFSCRSGSCGECKVMILEGDVAMEADDGLMPDDRTAGFRLTCVGRACGRVILEA